MLRGVCFHFLQKIQIKIKQISASNMVALACIIQTLTIHHHLSDNSKIMGSLNYHKLDGYRKHAGFENKSAFVKFTHQKNEVLHKLSILHFDSPYAYDSGGLTLEEVNRNRIARARKKHCL